jgi:hypothetical protein
LTTAQQPGSLGDLMLNDGLLGATLDAIYHNVVYSFAEWMIRNGARQNGQFAPDQKGKTAQRTTFKWIGFLFYGVAEVTIEIRKEVHLKIANLKDSMLIAISVLGDECKKYYGMEA